MNVLFSTADEFKNVFYSLECLTQVKEHKEMFNVSCYMMTSISIPVLFNQIGQAREMRKIKARSGHTIPHFWYCSSVCKPSPTTSDEEALKVMKVCYLVEYTRSIQVVTINVCI